MLSPGSRPGKMERPQAMPRVRGVILFSCAHWSSTTVANSDTTSNSGCSSLGGRYSITLSNNCSCECVCVCVRECECECVCV